MGAPLTAPVQVCAPGPRPGTRPSPRPHTAADMALAVGAAEQVLLDVALGGGGPDLPLPDYVVVSRRGEVAATWAELGDMLAWQHRLADARVARTVDHAGYVELAGVIDGRAWRLVGGGAR